jgi:hypothetical protein
VKISKKQNKILWEKTLERYNVIFDILKGVYGGIHDEGNSALNIPRCEACRYMGFHALVGISRCKGCPIGKKWGLCGDADSKWNDIRRKMEELLDAFEEAVESARIETK